MSRGKLTEGFLVFGFGGSKRQTKKAYKSNDLFLPGRINETEMRVVGEIKKNWQKNRSNRSKHQTTVDTFYDIQFHYHSLLLCLVLLLDFGPSKDGFHCAATDFETFKQGGEQLQVQIN